MSVPNFSQLKRRIEQLGASLEVTYYALVLGSQDSDTGQYLQGFVPSTIDMAVIPHTPLYVQLPSGVDSQNVATGYTDSEIFEGDRIEDSSSLDYVITEVIQHGIGDTNVYYECELAMLFPYTQSDVVHPYPAPPTSGGMTLNVGVKTWNAQEIKIYIASSTDSIDKTNTISIILSTQVT